MQHSKERMRSLLLQPEKRSTKVLKWGRPHRTVISLSIVCSKSLTGRDLIVPGARLGSVSAVVWLSQLTFCLSTFPSVCTWQSSMCLTTHLDLALLDPKAWLKPVTQQQPALSQRLQQTLIWFITLYPQTVLAFL